MRRVPAAIAALALIPLAACGGSTTNDEQSYRIDQPITGLVVDARAAAVVIDAGDGPVTVTEKYRYSGTAPATAHRVDGPTLHLTESGCGSDDDARCETEFHVRMPGAASARITAQAGAVKVHGLAGDVHITTEAGAVEGTGLSAGTVEVKTKAGATSLEFAAAPSMLRATTELGAVEVKVPGDTAYAIDVDTDVGGSDVSVRKDAASPHKISVRAQVGGVSIEPLP
jgi:Putative adhesin